MTEQRPKRLLYQVRDAIRLKHYPLGRAYLSTVMHGSHAPAFPTDAISISTTPSTNWRSNSSTASSFTSHLRAPSTGRDSRQLARVPTPCPLSRYSATFSTMRTKST